MQRALLDWYQEKRRELPWRGESDPYRILLSEVLLQQTRVNQAIPYYRRFLERFPTLAALAKAPLEEVLRVWQGAGYYARARNLHRLSQQAPTLVLRHEQLLRLPGLGPYTAAAVASIAFGEPVAAVDGNVRRVLSRFFAWENPTSRQIQEKADQLLQREAPGDWNQALMELGATVVRHRFTHRKLTVKVYRARWDGPGYRPTHKPLSKLDQKILKKCLPCGPSNDKASAFRPASGQAQPLFAHPGVGSLAEDAQAQAVEALEAS
ncbi:MAG: hypothetical protein HZB27_00815 [Meiothermus silvanus]|nr:hypothetical protein [Allomeiothermus silvanus]